MRNPKERLKQSGGPSSELLKSAGETMWSAPPSQPAVCTMCMYCGASEKLKLSGQRRDVSFQINIDMFITSGMLRHAQIGSIAYRNATAASVVRNVTVPNRANSSGTGTTLTAANTSPPIPFLCVNICIQFIEVRVIRYTILSIHSKYILV